MKRALSVLASLTPRQLLVRAWLVLLCSALLANFKPLSGLGAAIGFAVVVGYPYVVALGMAPKSDDAGAAKLARNLFYLWVLVLAAVAALLPFEGAIQLQPSPTNLLGWVSISAAVLVNIVVFAPFFLATRFLDEARRRTGSYVHFQSIPTFLGFYFGIFGGYLYVHRLVREVEIASS